MARFVPALLPFALLAALLAVTPSPAAAAAVSDQGIVRIGELQGGLPLGKHARVANLPEANLDSWFASPGEYLRALVEAMPASTPLSRITGESDLALSWRRNAADKLLLDAPGRLSLVVIDLVNENPAQRHFMLDVSEIDGIAWLYRDDNGELVGHADDFSEPLGGRPVVGNRASIPLDLTPGHKYRLYVAAFTITDTRHASMTIWNDEEFRAEKLRSHVADGVYFGLVIALILYNLFLFVALREYTYLFFSLFVAASGGEIYVGSGMFLLAGFQHTFPQGLPLAYFFQGMVGLFGALFTVSLLNIRNSSRPLYHVWLAVVVLELTTTPAIMYIARDGGYSTADVGVTFLIAVGVWLAIQSANVATLIHYWGKSNIAKYWFLGIVIHTWALTLWPIILEVSIDPVIAPYHLAQIATVLDTILLSALISYRYRTEQISRVEAQQRSVENLRLAHDLEKAKSNFVATVGHDLRGPVQAIRHFTESLRPVVAERSRDSLDRIDENVATVSELIDSMMELSRLESRANEPDLEDVSMYRLLSELQTEFIPKAGEKGIQLRIDGTRCIVRSDRVCLSRILRNLVDNAIKYTNEGYVSVKLEEELYSVRIVVKDTGRGIRDDELDKIFDEFYRGQEDNSDTIGVGLGLSIVARLTRLLGIEVTVRSQYGVGSSFELTLERALTGVEATAATTKEKAFADAPLKASLKGVKVLIVNQDNVLVDALGDLLVKWGANVLRLRYFHDVMKYMDSFLPDMIVSESISYQRMVVTLNSGEIERLFADDIPFLIAASGDQMRSKDWLVRTNHRAFQASIEPMAFRALIQRNVGLRSIPI